MRNPEENMMKKIVAFQTHLKLVDNALKSAKTGLKKLQEMKDKLETLYFSLVESHHFYKADVISKESKTEELFNGRQDDDITVSYVHNNTWADSQMAKYVDGTEKIEDKMKELEKAEVKPPDNSTHETEEKVDHVVTEVESERASVQRSIDSFVAEVNSLDKIQFATASAMEKFSEKLKMRLEVLVQKSRKVNDTLRGSINDFYDTECAKLDKCLLEICTKVEDSVTSPLTAVHPPSRSTSGKELVHLEKSKPPKFGGNEVDYPEFKRKWLSIVSKANLPQESEVDKLTESLPKDAKDQLYGVTTTAKAWEILDKRFGDPRIISMKLKAQLKNVQTSRLDAWYW